jgi:hypothetical protein
LTVEAKEKLRHERNAILRRRKRGEQLQKDRGRRQRKQEEQVGHTSEEVREQSGYVISCVLCVMTCVLCVMVSRYLLRLNRSPVSLLVACAHFCKRRRQCQRGRRHDRRAVRGAISGDSCNQARAAVAE